MTSPPKFGKLHGLIAAPHTPFDGNGNVNLKVIRRQADLLVRYGGVAAAKAMMAVHGIDAGDPRPPLKALTAAEKKTIVIGLKDILGK